MIETRSTLDLRLHLGDLLNRVALRQDAFIIERKGKALAAMVPVEKLRQLEKLARLRLLEALSPGKGGPSDREADAMADEAKHRSRRRRAR